MIQSTDTPVKMPTAPNPNFLEPHRRTEGWKMEGNARHRPTVLVAFENPRVARFLEGVLRNGFRVEVVKDCREALAHVEQGTPDLMLCDIGCLTNDYWGRLGAVDEYYGFFEIPTIVVCNNQPQHYAEMVKMRFGAVDCVNESLPPRVLRWKVRNWIYLKDQVGSLKRLERQAREKIRKVESQIETLVHDLKSPVIALRGFVKALGRQLESEGMDSRMEEAFQGLNGLSEAIEDLVEESRHLTATAEERPDAESVHLDKALSQVVCRHQHLTNSKGISLEIRTSAPTGTVRGRASKIKQVVENLLVNAVLHMGSRPDPRILITTTQTDDSLIASISDNGIGIPRDYQARIFDRFFRVPGTHHPEGQGLGLSIVKEIVESMNGRVWVDSEPGQGATFSFSLPRSAP